MNGVKSFIEVVKCKNEKDDFIRSKMGLIYPMRKINFLIDATNRLWNQPLYAYKITLFGTILSLSGLTLWERESIRLTNSYVTWLILFYFNLDLEIDFIFNYNFLLII